MHEHLGQDVSLLLATLRKTIKERLEKDDEVGRFVAFATRVASSLLNEFCALNWTGPGRSEPACVRFHWDVSSSQWVSRMLWNLLLMMLIEILLNINRKTIHVICSLTFFGYYFQGKLSKQSLDQLSLDGEVCAMNCCYLCVLVT